MSINIKDNIMGPELNRTYEISLWTLQDSFIAVLGDSSSQYKGYIENPTMQLSNDGTQELDFTLPMYIDDGITRRKSNIWAQMTDAITIAGMRKIKVVFNKGTENQAIYEFIITRVTDTHEQNQPRCEIHCEGLAFHELGKIGYKLSLSREGYEADNAAAWEELVGEDIETQLASVPQPTLDYWCEKIGLTILPENESDINSSIWYYRVTMDWSGFSYGYDRKSNKVYEEAYVSSYHTPTDQDTVKDLVAESYSQYKEKYRYVEAGASNIYNLTQEIAKTFGVYCRYDYLHDDNFHIIGRIITFYNNFIDERNRLEFTYPYTSKKITRENDCTDLVTKMYVNTIENENSSTGLLTIMDNPVNPTGEDYLLNFDYLFSIGTITNEQYEYVKEFSWEVRKLNNDILYWQEYQIKRDTVEVTYSAQLQVLENAIIEDTEQISTYSGYVNKLTNQGKLSRSGATGVLLYVIDGTITFRDEGILTNTIKLYEDSSKAKQVKIGTVILDTKNKEKGYATGISGITGVSQVFAEYDYYPYLYYNEVIDLYTKRKGRDTAARNALASKIDTLTQQSQNAAAQLQELQEQKATLLKKFERIMGPALREGNWTPEDYSNVANASYQFSSSLTLSKPANEWNQDIKTIKISSDGPAARLMWDSNLNYNEPDVQTTGISGENTAYYVCTLNAAMRSEVAAFYADQNNAGVPFGLVWWDNAYGTQNSQSPSPVVKMIVIGANCECSFVDYNDDGQKKIMPALILTDLTTAELSNINNNDNIKLFLCGIKTVCNNGNFSIVRTDKYTTNSNANYYEVPKDRIVISTNQASHQLRFHIPDYSLLLGENNLHVQYGDTEFVEYDDYSVDQSIHTTNISIEDRGYDITIKPLSLLKLWGSNKTLKIDYKLSQLSTAVYLDAVQILKENAYPKVTYTVDPNLIYEEFFLTDYSALNKIAFINDNELQFDQVQGYISNVNLNLDKPWEDTIEVKNYKNKFEDIFTTIVAQTESMEKNEAIITSIGSTINLDGTISASNLISTLSASTLRYTMSTGVITLNKTEGVQATSDVGVISLKPLGLCIATQKNSAGEWVWTKVITPSGISADTITSGTLSLNKVLLTDESSNLVIANNKIQLDNKENLYVGNENIEDYVASHASTVISTWWGQQLNNVNINKLTVKEQLKVGEINPIFSYQKQNNVETATLAGWSLDNTNGLTYTYNNTLVSKIAPTEFVLNNYLTVDNNGVTAKTLRIEPDSNGHIITFVNSGEGANNYQLKIDSEGLYYSLDDGTTWNKVAIETPTEPEPEPEPTPGEP